MSSLSIQNLSTSPLNPIATHDPSRSMLSNDRWKKVWAAASIITAIAFTTLGVLAITLTSILWPANLPIVTISILGGALPLSYQPIKYMWNKSDRAENEALVDKQLIKLSFEFKPNEIPQILKTLGISYDAQVLSIKDSALTQLLARYKYFEKEKADFIDQSNNTIVPSDPTKIVEIMIEGKIHRINPSDYKVENVKFDDPLQTNIFNTLQTLRVERENLIRRAALCNLKAAYVLRLIQSPQDQRNLGDFFVLTTENYLRQTISAKYGDASAYAIIKSKDGKLYTKEEVLAKSPTQLAKKIFELKSTSYWPFS